MSVNNPFCKLNCRESKESALLPTNRPPLTRSPKRHTFRHRWNPSPSADEKETHQGGGPYWFVSDANSRAGRRTVLETGRMRETNEQFVDRSEEHTSELQSRLHLVCRL